jgi:hypothetical protein
VKKSGLPSGAQRALVLALFVAILALIASSDELHAWLTSILPAAEAIIRSQPVLGVSVFVLFAAASAMLAFVSSAAIVPVGVFVLWRVIMFLVLWSFWFLLFVLAYVLSRVL